MNAIIKKNKTTFDAERDAANTKFQTEVRKDGILDRVSRNATSYALEPSSAADNETSRPGRSTSGENYSWEDTPGAWPFRSARVSRVKDQDLRDEAAGRVKDYLDNPHAGIRADYKGPWFSASRAQKQELEYGVKRLKDASRYMSWNAEDAYRRLENLDHMVTGFDRKDHTGRQLQHAKGIKDALEQSNNYVDRIAIQTPEDLTQMAQLAESYLDIPVFGEELASNADVHVPHLKPVDEVTLTDSEKNKVRFYRQDKDGRCNIYKDVTLENGVLIRGACKATGKPNAKWGDRDGLKLLRLNFEVLSGSFEDLNGYKRTASSLPPDPRRAKVGDDECGYHEVDCNDKSTAEKVLSLVDLGRRCERDSGKEAFALSQAFTISNAPTLAAPLIDENNPLKKQLAAVTPYKYYNYLLKEGPGREELNHRLALPPEISGVPS